MKDKTKQTTVIGRIWGQITALVAWIREQGRSILLTSLVMAILFVSLAWITWETYRRNNLGFGTKTYWDWMELLVIPVVLAIGAWWLNKSERESEREIAENNRKEDRAIADERRNQATLEAYFDRMVELLLEHDLMDNESESEILPTIARTRTLAVLRSIDEMRKGHVVQFLHESGLIARDRVVVELRGADLTEAYLSGANLRRANLAGAGLIEADLSLADLSGASLFMAGLSWANLSWAHLSGANLSDANLNGANLSEADLSLADLSGANLSWADLSGTRVTDEQLAQAKSLKGATMPDGTKHD